MTTPVALTVPVMVPVPDAVPNVNVRVPLTLPADVTVILLVPVAPFVAVYVPVKVPANSTEAPELIVTVEICPLLSVTAVVNNPELLNEKLPVPVEELPFALVIVMVYVPSKATVPVRVDVAPVRDVAEPDKTPVLEIVQLTFEMLVSFVPLPGE